tara:strand:+ start:116 stop:283 length:168 start_codon:yes stop_codon:yes gene_type:complete
MTRKDYKEFAELIKASVNNPEIFTITDVAYGMCVMFKEDNRKFNRDLFLKACDLK